MSHIHFLPPEEKALELFSEYRFLLSVPGAPLGDRKDEIAKECAKLFVSKMIDSGLITPQEKRHYILGKNPYPSELEYWQQVMKSIETL